MIKKDYKYSSQLNHVVHAVWRSSYPAEVCDDSVDNDCDGLTDCWVNYKDTDCNCGPECYTSSECDLGECCDGEIFGTGGT